MRKVKSRLLQCGSSLTPTDTDGRNLLVEQSRRPGALQKVYNLLQRELGVHATRKRTETALAGRESRRATAAWIDEFW